VVRTCRARPTIQTSVNAIDVLREQTRQLSESLDKRKQ
jgi:hypothetical protein